MLITHSVLANTHPCDPSTRVLLIPLWEQKQIADGYNSILLKKTQYIIMLIIQQYITSYGQILANKRVKRVININNGKTQTFIGKNYQLQESTDGVMTL